MTGALSIGFPTTARNFCQCLKKWNFLFRINKGPLAVTQRPVREYTFFPSDLWFPGVPECSRCLCDSSLKQHIHAIYMHGFKLCRFFVLLFDSYIKLSWCIWETPQEQPCGRAQEWDPTELTISVKGVDKDCSQHLANTLFLVSE